MWADGACERLERGEIQVQRRVDEPADPQRPSLERRKRRRRRGADEETIGRRDRRRLWSAPNRRLAQRREVGELPRVEPGAEQAAERRRRSAARLTEWKRRDKTSARRLREQRGQENRAREEIAAREGRWGKPALQRQFVVRRGQTVPCSFFVTGPRPL
jgi:hypothetical protein